MSAFYALFTAFAMNVITANTTNTKNKILAIPAAPAAIPPNQKSAATTANIKKINAQRNMLFQF